MQVTIRVPSNISASASYNDDFLNARQRLQLKCSIYIGFERDLTSTAQAFVGRDDDF